MKAFLRNIIKFFLLFYGVLFILVYGTNFIFNKNASFKLDKTITKIIIGNSQPECAYNDSLISKFKNLAKSGETYFYSYQKLKKVLEQNPQIKTVFIEFNPTNILIREDEKIWGDRYINHLLPNYQPFLKLKDNALLAYKNNSGYHHAILKSLYKNTKRISLGHYNFIDSIGGYQYLKRYKTKAILDTLTIRNIKQVDLEKTQLSNYDLTYLSKIIALCNQSKINFYLVRSPYHEKFIGNIYESSFQQIRQERFVDIEFLDFRDYPLNHSDYADLQHLNHRGAHKFSNWFNEWCSENTKD